jgi:hypothetical protein
VSRLRELADIRTRRLGGYVRLSMSLNLVYVPRLTLSTTHAAACGLEVTRTWYVQRINGDGSAEREFRFHVNNTGEADCSSSAVHLASIAA